MTTATIGPKSKPKATSPKNQMPPTVGIPAGMPFKTPPERTKKKASAASSTRTRPNFGFSDKAKQSTSDNHSRDGRPPMHPAASVLVEESRSEETPKPAKPLTELETLVANVQSRVPGSQQLLHDYIANKPEHYDKFGDLAGHARTLLADLIAGENVVLSQAILVDAEKLSERYKSGRHTCPTEDILIEQIVICKLRLDLLDAYSGAYVQENNPRLAKMMQRRNESAQSTLFRAIGQLEKFRQLKASKA